MRRLERFRRLERYGEGIFVGRLRTHVLSQKVSVLARGVVGLVLAYGCGSNPSGPLDPALSGKWVLPSVDSYSMFVLQQRGTVVTGTFGDYTANQPVSEVFIVSGAADLPHVVLRWARGRCTGDVRSDVIHGAGQPRRHHRARWRARRPCCATGRSWDA